MGELHPLSQPLEQRGRIRAADRAPEGVQFEHHPRIEVIDQHLQAAPTVEDRAGLELVIVVPDPEAGRSEERRVGKEGRSRWWPEDCRKRTGTEGNNDAGAGAV